MPDSWELANLLDPLNTADADQDADGDWHTNLDEYQLSSDPQDIASPGSPFLYTDVIQNVSSDSWTLVVLDHNYASLVIVATPLYDLPQVPTVVRIRNAVDNSFEVKVDRVDGQSAPIAVDVHYVVLEEGSYQAATHGITMEAVKYLSTQTDENNRWNGEQSTYFNSYVNPVVVRQIMSYNDSDFSVFWSRGRRVNSPADTNYLYVGKQVAEDPDSTRLDETIGYIVVEQGSGLINGFAYEAAVGGDTVVDLGSGGDTYGLQNLIPTSVVLSQSGMDGGNGDWAVLLADPDEIGIHLAIDEDQLKDPKRNHTTEQVSFIAFDDGN